jgi:dihydropteroate synthase
MGILNLTPDSFYDGGRYTSETASAARIDALVAEGADIVDIGGESTRPGSKPVSPSEQIARIRFAVKYAVERGGILVSVDTTQAEVAEHALELGAHLVNDVSCLTDPNLARVTAKFGASLVIMHARGSMNTMAGYSAYPEAGYGDVVEDVKCEWRAARDRALAEGLSQGRLLFDPGIGYNKSARHSFELLARLAEFRTEDVPIVVGPSRKSFIGSLDGTGNVDRLGGTIAACLASVLRGAAVLRVHDVREVKQALAVSQRVTDLSNGRPAIGA